MAAFEDLEAIKQLKARYFRCMDTKDWQGFASVFTEDATLDAGDDDPRGALRGRDAIVRRVSEVLRDAVTVHHGHMPEIELLGPASARGVWAMEDYVDLPQLVLRGWGHYHEEYAKQDGAWRIASLRLTRLRRDVTRK